MNNAICTLFEKHYHYGVSVLTNSLVMNGFKGTVFAGYRGSLPAWTNSAKPNDALGWDGAITMQVSDDVVLHLLPMKTDAHFTNYKAHFMLELWDGPAKNVDSMYYFDPDIVLVTNWSFFENWVKCGVAVCEDVNSPVWEFHPRRVGWQDYFGKFGRKLKVKEPLYANAGFMGVSKENREILEIWRGMMNELAPLMGGLNKSNVSGKDLPDLELGAFAAFGQPDQDVMNAAIMAYNGQISYAGKEGMAFITGAALIPHALGKIKPWVLKPISEWIKGMPPRYVDKQYWNYTSYPIKAHSSFEISKMKLLIKITALLGRFYRRSE